MTRIKGLFGTSILVLCVISLAACGGGLSGTYVSESGRYTIEFERSGKLTWFQDGHFFVGNYESTDAGYRLTVQGDGWYTNTVFEAVKDGGDLLITGGVIRGERFTRRNNAVESENTPAISRSPDASNIIKNLADIGDVAFENIILTAQGFLESELEINGGRLFSGATDIRAYGYNVDEHIYYRFDKEVNPVTYHLLVEDDELLAEFQEAQQALPGWQRENLFGMHFGDVNVLITFSVLGDFQLERRFLGVMEHQDTIYIMVAIPDVQLNSEGQVVFNSNDAFLLHVRPGESVHAFGHTDLDFLHTKLNERYSVVYNIESENLKNTFATKILITKATFQCDQI